MSLQPINLIGFDQQSGLKTYNKPVLLPDNAFQKLINAYPFRGRVRKREGLRLVGRLRRDLTGQSLGMTPAGPPNTITFTNIFTTLSITGENPELVPGTLVITVAAPDTATFTDQGNGTFLVTGAGVSAGSYIDYATGKVVLQFTALVGGAAITANLSYYPGLPVMGISLREIAAINDEQTIFFDTKYAYIWNGSTFNEFIPGTTWNGSDSDFFWTTNYRGINPQDRLFFATNFFNDVGSPMRYTDGATWTTFAPAVDAANFLFQARIIIPYFGRLLCMNVWEGATVAGSVNIFNRCRFSQLGSPVAADAFRSHQFGKGGFLDAPTNEAIIGATFLNNTLIIFFEKTTWQLRYVGEYGLPFIFERIASDLGSESTFSPVLFNNYILAIGDKAIIAADSNSVDRIDLDIPDLIFNFQNAENGVKRVQGIRDFQKELVYWCYADAQTQAAPGAMNPNTIYPNKVLTYNYRNKEWAIFRENVTAFGQLQFTTDTTWDSTVVTWDDEDITWDDFDSQSRFPFIVSGNQEGFIHLFGYTSPTEAALSITGVSFSGVTLSLTIKNHNLQPDDLIYVTDLQFLDATTFLPIPTDLNNKIYMVGITDRDTVSLAKWDFLSQAYELNFSFTPVGLTNALYIGGGKAALLIRPIIQTKDFNPYQQKGLQSKISYVDFLLDVTLPPTMGFITGATKANPCVITSVAHGLQSGQRVTIAGVFGMTQLNVGQFYTITVTDADHFSINVNSTNFATYTQGGEWTLVVADLTISIFLNSSMSMSGNLFTNNKSISAFGVEPFYGPGSDYQWHRFYATCTGQYINLYLTYDENLMNIYLTHKKELVIEGITIWSRPAGKVIF